MRVFGVMGHPISHSLSPVMHTAAFQALGLEAVYAPLDVPPSQVAAVLRGMQVMGMDGCNVTVPLKARVAAALGPSRLDEAAASLEAVNTVVHQAGALSGHNTDVEGFRRALAEELRFDGLGKRVLVLGAGGAARAVAWAVAQQQPAALMVANRTPAHAQRLVRWLRGHMPGLAVRTVPWAKRADALAAADLLVNATSLGLRADDPLPVEASAIRPRLAVFDVVYPAYPADRGAGRRAPTTRLVREARRRRAIAIDGLAMLIYQGAASFRLWWQREPPVDAMRRAVEHALRTNRHR